MMSGVISDTGRTDLVPVNGALPDQQYCDEIIQHHVVPIMQNNGRLLQHDNARPQTARVTTAYLQNNNIPVLPWQPKSPDLNPIEHLWDELDRRVQERQPPQQSLHQLVVALHAEWARAYKILKMVTLACECAINCGGK
jgi:transposase